MGEKIQGKEGKRKCRERRLDRGKNLKKVVLPRRGGGGGGGVWGGGGVGGGGGN